VGESVLFTRGVSVHKGGEHTQCSSLCGKSRSGLYSLKRGGTKKGSEKSLFLKVE